MELTWPTFMLVVPEDVLYDIPFVGDSTLVAKTTSNGACCARSLQIIICTLTSRISALTYKPSSVVKSYFLDPLPSSASRMTPRLGYSVWSWRRRCCSNREYPRFLCHRTDCTFCNHRKPEALPGIFENLADIRRDCQSLKSYKRGWCRYAAVFSASTRS